MAKEIKSIQSKSPATKTVATAVKRPVKSTSQKKLVWFFPLTKMNLVYLAIGVAVIIIGYAFMATGITNEPAVPDGKWNNFFAITLAPILLIIGYGAIVPYALLKRFDNKEEETQP